MIGHERLFAEFEINSAEPTTADLIRRVSRPESRSKWLMSSGDSATSAECRYRRMSARHASGINSGMSPE
jgi:hypothetical protein